MSVFTNIAAYKFAPLENLKPLREQLISQCKTWQLKGTILLSTEGINLFVAGGAAEIELLLGVLRAIPGLQDLTPKYSESDHQPFTRMLVRIKKEIIAFGVEGIRPGEKTSPKLPAKTLKQWLDEGRPVTLLDTRNDYEVKLGTFKGALAAGIDHFRDFPEAVRRLPSELKQQPIVMFCTGGIRCEKAGPFMEREGFQQIFQLDGGILKYFEECGGDHYEGECFVFDQRVGVDPSLHETDSGLCYVCQAPLTIAEQRDPRFVRGKSCPNCFRTSTEQIEQLLATRREKIRQVTTPLPGSHPYENRRPVKIPGAFDGKTILEALSEIFEHVPREEWIQILEQGLIETTLGDSVKADHPVRTDEQYVRVMPHTVEPDINSDLQVIYEDEAIVMLNKPAPLPMHPCGRFNRNTLQFILDEVYAPEKVRPAHRLDANTTGLVVCTRTHHFAKRLQPQFSRGEVQKTYLVRVQGHPMENSFFSNAPIGTEPGELGSRDVDETEGLSARTDFTVLQRFEDGTALLEARPLTGRTNQIRVHLWQLGFPVCGDPAYVSGGTLGDSQTLPVNAPPLCLHAWRLSFRHPRTNEAVSFETAKPIWAS